MLGVTELTELAIEALNAAHDTGCLLIRGEIGVIWDKAVECWKADTATGQAICDVGGALLLLASGSLALEMHRGDPERALRGLIAPEFYKGQPDPDLDTLFQSPVYELSRNFFHGWDGLGYVGGNEEAYEAGFYLAKQYYPMDYNLLLVPPKQ